MKKILIEEINRFKLLSNYDNRVTLSENKNLLLEFTPKLLRNLISKQGDAYNTLKKLEKSSGFLKGSKIELKGKKMANGEETIFTFNDSDELIQNLGNLDSVAEAHLLSDLFKNATSKEFKIEIAETISKSQGFIDKYSKYGNADDAITELKRVGGYTDEEAKLLLDNSGVSFNKLSKVVDKNLPIKKENIPTKIDIPNIGQEIPKWRKLLDRLKKGLPFDKKWKIFAGLGATAIIWWLMNDEESPFPLCLVNKLKQSDIEQFKNDTPDFILITNTGNKELDTYGGAKFYLDGEFETGNGRFNGNWELNDTQITINIDSGTEYNLPCSGLQDPNTGGGTSSEGETTSGTTKGCDTFPFTKGCVNPKINEIQKCLGVKQTSILDDETQKKLKENGFDSDISQTVYDKIMKDCVKKTKPITAVQSQGGQIFDL